MSLMLNDGLSRLGGGELVVGVEHTTALAGMMLVIKQL